MDDTNNLDDQRAISIRKEQLLPKNEHPSRVDENKTSDFYLKEIARSRSLRRLVEAARKIQAKAQ